MNKKRKINFKQFLTYIIRAVVSSLLISIIIYYVVTDGNEAIVSLLNFIKENNKANEFILTIFPILLIICSMTELGKYVATTSQKKKKIWNKKSNKKIKFYFIGKI